MNRVAVLVPVYRNQSGLDRTIESLRTSRGDFDLVIVDDGSPVPMVIPRTVRDRPVLHWRLEPNCGIAGALNFGLRRILERDYRYIGRLDSGDTVATERFERQTRYLDQDPACAAVSSFVDFVDSSGRTLFRYRPPCDHAEIVQRLHLGNCIVHSGVMMRAEAVQAVGLYREDVPCAEDYDLFLRLARRFTLAVLPEVLTYCEYSKGGLSVDGRRRHQRERLKLQLRYFDSASPYSFYGVARTCLAMAAPQWAVLRFKQACFR